MPRTASPSISHRRGDAGHHLIWQYADLFEVEKEWRWSGTHYRRTAEDWLKNFDAHRDEIERVLRDVYGEDAPLWMRRWRWFFLATAGLFGYADGQEWDVSHTGSAPCRAPPEPRLSI
jgi:cyclopropane-fatty-acyl-phospholipid synthase